MDRDACPGSTGDGFDGGEADDLGHPGGVSHKSVSAFCQIANKSESPPRGRAKGGRRMAWIRLDDDYISHPKFTALSDRAFRLWHEGMAYCRKLMTDGLILSSALQTFRYATRRAIRELLTPASEDTQALWATDPKGVRVHDYLDWNPSHQEEAEEREAAKQRMRAYRGRARAPTVTPLVTGAVTPSVTPLVTPNVTPLVTPPVPGEGQGTGSDRQKERSRDKITARSHRPIFTGTRFVVFDWQLDNINRLLGDKALQAFNIDSFFHDLNARVDRENVMVPQRDSGVWLLAEVAAEAHRRGIAVVIAPEIGAKNKRIAGAIAGGNAFLKRGEL